MKTTKKEYTTKELAKALSKHLNLEAKSAWKRGVVGYAEDMLANLSIHDDEPSRRWSCFDLEAVLLGGAKSWKQCSYGCCYLVSNAEIAERLCTPSQLKRKKGGLLPPKPGVYWLDVQTTALSQASKKVLSAYWSLLQAETEEA